MSNPTRTNLTKKSYEKVLDAYFKRPIFWDILTAGILMTTFDVINIRDLIGLEIHYVPESYIETMSTSIITFAGFVLTIITIIITFKNTLPEEFSEVHEKNDKSEQPVKSRPPDEVKSKVVKFYHSKYYEMTLALLMNSVKIMFALFFLLISCYFINNLSQKIYLHVLLCSLILTIFTLFRFLLILKIIIDFQKDNTPKD